MLIPWIGVLAARIPFLTGGPSTGNGAWIGLDMLETVSLMATGLLLRRRDRRVCLAAAATAALLCTDAWFDLMTATAAQLPYSIAMAGGAELPIAALCVRIVLRWFAASRG